ncbi:hypothetical protein [Aureispira anguillae]|uniref:Uncharacterized protein n=1 Tax=Aureispira anguillae TaxID=2864201 RepID=A0A916DUS5_9BACT|nr:hypothetical protein [Aureispira anguillae]BDS12491.1 hypothetical protein AsAng_0032140 [Aureispira anguillae]
MASQSKKLQKLEVELKSMKAILIKYKDYFKVDGFVDTEEQKQLIQDVMSK